MPRSSRSNARSRARPRRATRQRWYLITPCALASGTTSMPSSERGLSSNVTRPRAHCVPRPTRRTGGSRWSARVRRSLRVRLRKGSITRITMPSRSCSWATATRSLSLVPTRATPSQRTSARCAVLHAGCRSLLEPVRAMLATPSLPPTLDSVLAPGLNSKHCGRDAARSSRAVRSTQAWACAWSATRRCR